MFDRWAYTIASAGVPVDVMGGKGDPTNSSLPQQPMQPSLFPMSFKLSNFTCVTNPYDCDIGGIRVIGSSGQPIADELQYLHADPVIASTDGDAAMAVESSTPTPAPPQAKILAQKYTLPLLEQHIHAQHIAPTCPDSLPSFPFAADPFLLPVTPHIYFSTNCSEFSTVEVEGMDGQRVTVLSIPSWTDSHGAAVIDLSSRKCAFWKVGAL
jgi:DNA polymerase delta subunit 2